MKKKSKKSVTKRFKLTGRGKLRRHKAYKRHILTKKAPKRKRHLRSGTLASRADRVRIKHLLSA